MAGNDAAHPFPISEERQGVPGEAHAARNAVADLLVVENPSAVSSAGRVRRCS
jgi:hypothetical protein